MQTLQSLEFPGRDGLCGRVKDDRTPSALARRGIRIGNCHGEKGRRRWSNGYMFKLERRGGFSWRVQRGTEGRMFI